MRLALTTARFSAPLSGILIASLSPILLLARRWAESGRRQRNLSRLSQEFGTAIYSMSLAHRSTLGFGAGYIRLSSVANSVSSTYATLGFSANYGINLWRYLNANFRYDFLHYDGLFGFSSLNKKAASRLAFRSAPRAFL